MAKVIYVDFKQKDDFERKLDKAIYADFQKRSKRLKK